MEKRGIPTITVITDSFLPLAKLEAGTFGITDLPVLVIPHPVAVLDGQQLTELAAGKVEEAFQYLFGSIDSQFSEHASDSLSSIIDAADDLDSIIELFNEKQWTDGLPIVPPTVKRVDDFIQGSGLSRNQVIGFVPPQNGLATVESIAVNCVMAGCKPEYLPVVVTALEAMLQPEFNLRGVQTTTHPCAPLVIVNGPIAERIGMNGSANVFGQGNQANATIGRAIRLILQNIGGASPGKRDRATQGQPSKYSYCITENEDMNPWGPLRADFNYGDGDSVVTVMAAENPHNINDHFSSKPEGLLATITDASCTMGMNNMYLSNSQVVLCLCPEHAKIFAENGWDKNRIKGYVFRHARKTVSQLKAGGMFNMREWPDYVNENDDLETVPLVQNPQDIYILVAGGDGKHSSFIPTFGLSKSVTKRISKTSVF